MPRNNKEPSFPEMLFDAFVELPAWVGPFVAALVFVGLGWLFPWVFESDGGSPLKQNINRIVVPICVKIAPWAAIGVVGIWGAALFKKIGNRQRLEKQNGIESIRELSWSEFELLLSEAFRRQSFSVEHSGGSSPDGGVDQRLRKNGELTLVQCKHWKTKQVGVKIVRELLGVITSEKANHGIVVTSGSFTKPAREFAKQNDIKLIDGDELEGMIREVQSLPRDKTQTAEPPSKTTAPASSDAQTTPACPKCGSTMKRRIARKGPNAGSKFWGCSNFPKCRGTRA